MSLIILLGALTFLTVALSISWFIDRDIKVQQRHDLLFLMEKYNKLSNDMDTQIEITTKIVDGQTQIMEFFDNITKDLNKKD